MHFPKSIFKNYISKTTLFKIYIFKIAPQKNILKTAFSKNVNFMTLIYSSSDSSDSSSEEESLKLSLTCLTTFFSIYLYSFKFTCG